MNKGISSAATGVTAALIAGTAVYMMANHGTNSMTHSRKIKRSAEKAVRKAGIVIDGVAQLLR